MRLSDLSSSPKTITKAASDGNLWDTDALKTSVATDDAAAHTYSGAALDGAAANPGPAVLSPPRFFSVSTTTDAATYNTTDPIVVTGTYDGQVVTEELTLTQAGGNEYLVGDQPFDTIESVYVPIQLTTNGAFTFGLDGYAAGKVNGQQQFFRQIRANAAGNVKLGFRDGTTDIRPCQAYEHDPVAPIRVYGSPSTNVEVTIYT